MGTEPSNRVLTVPNLLTLLRLLLLPVYFVLFTVYHNDVAAFVVFLIAASTDFLDGVAARALNQVSRLGQQFDPLVDRLLIIIGVIGVFIMGRVPLWLLGVLIVRDIIMLALTLYQQARFNISFKVVFIGKLTTALIMAGFCLLIINLPLLPGLGLVQSNMLPGWGENPASPGIWLLYVGTVCSCISAIFYLKRGLGYKHNTADRIGKQFTDSARNQSAEGTGTSLSAGSRSTKTKHAKKKDSKIGAHAHTKQKKPQSTSKHAARSANIEIFNTPKKLRIGLAILAVFLIIAAFYCVDVVRNYGVIHSGVRIAGVDVGSLTVEEASKLLEEELARQAAAHPVYLYGSSYLSSDQGSASDENLDQELAAAQPPVEIDLTQGFPSPEVDGIDPTLAQSWSISAATISVDIDGLALAEEAYTIGRGSDFILGRLVATFAGVQLAGSLEYSGTLLATLEHIITQGVGWLTVEGNIFATEQGFEVSPGKDGFVVDHELFCAALNAAFLTENRSVVIPMTTENRRIDEEKAVVAQQIAIAATNESVEVTEDGTDHRWTLESHDLRFWVSTTIKIEENGGSETAQLVPFIDERKLQQNLDSIIDVDIIGIPPVNARFMQAEDGSLTIVESIDGAGIDYRSLAMELDDVVFGPYRVHENLVDSSEDSSDTSGISSTTSSGISSHASTSSQRSRSVIIPIGVLHPQLSTQQAKDLHITDLIASFTTTFPGSTDARRNNIHVASEMVNGTLIAPGATWSFNENVFDYTEEAGFQKDRAIMDDQLVDAIGGGVCQVATTVFNAAFDAGLPIVERTNHSLYTAYYPDGRDATISYPSVDLKFLNDTPNWMVLTMQYDYYQVTATLWGIDPGYSVVVQVGDWTEGEKFETKVEFTYDRYDDEREVKTVGKDGKNIHVTRDVYDRDGNLLRTTVFRSWYNPVTEVVEIGTRPRPPVDTSNTSTVP